MPRFYYDENKVERPVPAPMMGWFQHMRISVEAKNPGVKCNKTAVFKNFDLTIKLRDIPL
jgi:hypothetical protein